MVQFQSVLVVDSFWLYCVVSMIHIYKREQCYYYESTTNSLLKLKGRRTNSTTICNCFIRKLQSLNTGQSFNYFSQFPAGQSPICIKV